MNRYLEKYILKDLNEKMVFLGGPRQTGKTTLSLDIAQKKYKTNFTYLNWDNLDDKKNILKTQYKGGSKLIIFDEIHKYNKWKNFIKGEYDKNKKKYKILVTGSARLDIYQKGGDSLLGRYFYYVLHPFSLGELSGIKNSFDNIGELKFKNKFYNQTLADLIKFGGFPEVYIGKNERNMRRWHNNRMDKLVKEDIRDLSNIKNISSIQLLVSMLPEKVGSLFSINSVRENLFLNHKTVANYLEILERVYYVYRIYPYNSKKIKSIKKEPKIYLWDWSEIDDMGIRSENVIAGHLLKFAHFLRDYHGYKVNLFFLRDREQREVDFLLEIDSKIEFLVEVKLKYKSISKNLKYFSKKMGTKNNYQVIIDTEEEIDFEKENIRVISASKFLTALI